MISAIADASEREAAFWALMTKRRHPASAFRLSKVDLSPLGDQRVQPLEILVVDTLAHLCPEVEWSATQVQGDGGVDFHGAAKTIRLAARRKNIDFRYTIVGQVKRSRRYRMELLAATFTGVRDRVQTAQISISQFLFVISAHSSALARFAREAPRIGAHAFPGVPVSVLDAEDLIWLWVQAGEEIFEALQPAFTTAEFDFLKSYLAELAALWRIPTIRCVVSPAKGRLIVGGDLELKVTIQTAAPAGRLLAVQWLPGDQVDVIRPLSMLSSPALVALNERGEGQLILKLRARAAGSVSLGELRIHSVSRDWTDPRPMLSSPLGELDIKPDPTFRRVRFQRAPNTAAIAAIDRFTQSTAARGVEILALLGPAGVGKSRLLDDLFNRLHGGDGVSGQRLWSLLRIDHDAQRASRRFLRDLLIGLAMPDGAAEDEGMAAPEAAVYDWLQRFVGGESQALKRGINALWRREDGEVEAAAFALLTALIARLREGPVALHLANMHWADNFEIEVLLELIHRLDAVEQQLPHGVLLILEGREGEMVEADAGYDLTTEAWRRLYDNEQICSRVSLKPWSQQHSRRILEELIEGVAARSLADGALQDRVIDHVLSCSQGNPLQIIEHLRILIDNGWLSIETDGSAVFEPPPQLPSALVAMIAARVEFINRTPLNDEIVALLRLCAEIGLWVEADLFSAMTGVMSDARLLTTLAQWHVARLPGDGASDFEFLHEAYRDAFRRVGWRRSAGEPLRVALLTRLAPTPASPSEHVIAWSRVTRLDPGCDLNIVARALEHALERSRGPQGQIAVCRELLSLPRAVLDHGVGWFALALRLVDLLLMHGDWHEALRVIERVQKADSVMIPLSPLEQAEIAHRAGNILGDLNRIDEGLRQVRRGLAALDDPRHGRLSPEEIAVREVLHNRLGVLLWFSGRLDEGISYQFRAWRSAVRHDPGGERELLLACEIGTALSGRYPRRGLKLLERSADLFVRLADRCDLSLDYVLVQREIVRLVGVTETDRVLDVRERLRAFLEAQGSKSVYAEALAWQTAGACDFLLGDREQAQLQFAEAIASAARCRNRRLMWKAHLAYATVAAGDGPRALGHARYAGKLLVESLDHVEMHHRARWESAIHLPLEHARRLTGFDPVIEEALEKIRAGRAPDWIADWARRPIAASRSHQPFQLLHVRSGAEDIFLMG